ncbi:UTP--glucose-1-phosphate uridylyltransferase [candidate division WWE3 bacterium]|uniref:UTP--glucose-1-phosphate uridylyltransferase n=1 Tax=candidate division WWE3 bacterium TaxID=2053526 RepID=A0A955LVI4_UNCKA|nr:UTP--glucose-1-phosphate uridylyltransferase [candidate division WWE3 bacterium]
MSVSPSSRKVTKAVIAAAGYGTRFLPATKNQPKEMLPIIDKPIIHYLVEECVNSGITDIILVTRAGQHIMEDYFDNNYELEYSLEKSGKEARLRIVKNIPQMANFVYVRQKGHLPYGNGSPLVAAAPLIDDDEPFAYLFGDDMVLSKVPCIQQLKEVYEKNDCDGVIAAQEIPLEESYRYGIVKFKEGGDEFEALVEKPDPSEAPSNMAEFGRFILNNRTVKEILEINTGLDGELWLVDAITAASNNGGRFLVHNVDGNWMTTGDPLRYMKTMVEFALDREDLGEDFRDYLKSLNL